MAKKQPATKHENKPLPVPRSWKYVAPPPGGMVLPVSIEPHQVVLAFRPEQIENIGRPVDAEAGITLKLRALPAVARYQPVRQEVGRLQELLRTAREALADAERKYDDPGENDSIIELADAVVFCQSQVREAQQQLDEFLPVAAKAYEAARVAYVKLASAEQNRFVEERRAAFAAAVEGTIPQIALLVEQLGEARRKYATAQRMMLPGCITELGEAPAAAPAPAPQGPAPLVTNKPVPCSAAVMR